MPNRLARVLGAVLAAGGLLVGIGSLAMPWARYRVRGTALDQVPVTEQANAAVFQLPGGVWYLMAIMALAGLLAMAALGTGRLPAASRSVAPVGGLLTALLVVFVANSVSGSPGSVVATGVADLRVTAETGPGVWAGLVAGPLLGFGAGLVGLARHRAAAAPAASGEPERASRIR